jgi:hypothetical protein
MDTAEAGLFVNVDVASEIRICVDSHKLARLARISVYMSTVSKTGSGSVGSDVYDQPSTAAPSRRPSSTISDDGDLFAEYDSKGEDVDKARTSSSPRKMMAGAVRKLLKEKPLKKLLGINLNGPVGKNKSGVRSKEIEASPDPTAISYRIEANFVMLALELSYERGSATQSMVFACEGLSVSAVCRLHDQKISTKLTSISVEDSSRVLEQRTILRSPLLVKSNASDMETIQIEVVRVTSKASPYYKIHALDIRLVFPELFMSLDVITISRIKPFFGGVFDISGSEPASSVTAPKSPEFSSVNDSATAIALEEDKPTGVNVDACLGKVSVDILRTSSSLLIVETYLEPSYSLIINEWKMIMELGRLVSCTIRLRGFEIKDCRLSSQDYVFRHLLCSGRDLKKHHSESSCVLNDITEINHLVLTYSEESSLISLIECSVSDAAFFLSLDAFGDFGALFIDNFMAIMGLFTTTSATLRLLKESGNGAELVYTMNTIVALTNTSFALIEDPALYEPAAVISRCDLAVQYINETKLGLIGIELFDSIHVTASQMKAFVLPSLHQWAESSSFTTLLEPFPFELHFKQKTINDVAVLRTLVMDLEEINITLSFNELMLILSIFSRLSSIATSPVREVGDDNDHPSSVNCSSSSSELDSSAVTASSIRVSIGLNLFSLMIISSDDFLVPLLKLTAAESVFSLEGREKIHGEGSTIMKADYFNCLVSNWEPVLEPWKPTISIISEGMDHSVEICSEHTLQLTLSGSEIQTLLKLISFYDESSKNFNSLKDRRGSYLYVESRLTFNNSLGETVVLEVYDSLSGKMVTQLSSENQTEPFLFQKESELNRRKEHLKSPSSVNVVVKHPLIGERQPLIDLPLNILKPKPYFLHSSRKEHPGKETGNSIDTTVDPIEVEVFENQRYDPLTGSWGKPYLFNDPQQYTDSFGIVQNADFIPSSDGAGDCDDGLRNSDCWEWFGQWEVDMDGAIGREIDIYGWEYGASFSSFSDDSCRRKGNIEFTNIVRRRRWIRMRIPKVRTLYSDQDYWKKSLICIWDVKLLKDGIKYIEMKSAFTIQNDLGIGVSISLDLEGRGEHVVERIPGNSEYNVPLVYSTSSRIKFKPLLIEKNDELVTSSSSYMWSDYCVCKTSSYESKVVKTISCPPINANDSAQSEVSFRVWIIRKNRTIKLILAPFVTITNKLLCGVHYRLLGFTSTFPASLSEEKKIVPGESAKMYHITSNQELKLSFQIGAYQCSSPISISLEKAKTERIISMETEVVGNMPSNSILPICMKSIISEITGSIEVEVYFQIAMINRSSISLSVRSFSPEMIRSLDYTPFLSPVLPDGSLALHNISSVSAVDDDTDVVLLSDLVSASTGLFEVSTADIYSFVYTDIKCKWYYLPPALRSQLTIKFSFSDRNSRNNSFFSFTVTKKSYVFIMTDARVSSHSLSFTKWLNNEGYVKLSDIAVSRYYSSNAKDNNLIAEFYYHIFGKLIDPEQNNGKVVLKGAWDRDISCMYSVIIIPETKMTVGATMPLKQQHLSLDRLSSSNCNDVDEDYRLHCSYMSIYNQLCFTSNFDLNRAGLCWTEGSSNISVFYSEANVLSLSVLNDGRSINEENWSKPINVDTSKNSLTKGSFEVHSPRYGFSYQLAYRLSALPGLFHGKTQLVEFMPKFVIMNCCDENVYICQKGCDKHLVFFPYQIEGWHKILDTADVENQSLKSSYAHTTTEIKFRTSSTLWSLGCVDINDIGSSVLYIPYTDNTVTISHNGGNRGIVLHIEVKLAKPEDHCSIAVMIWQETISVHDVVQSPSSLSSSIGSATVSVRNDSSVPVTIRQADIEFEHDLKNSSDVNENGEELYEMTVLSGKQYPFGWTDPDIGSTVRIGAGTSLRGLSSDMILSINLLKAGQVLRLPYPLLSSTVDTDIHVHAGDGMFSRFLPFSSTNNKSDIGYLLVKTILTDSGHMLHITSDEESNVSLKTLSLDEEHQLQSSACYSFSFYLSSLGVSFVVEKPFRRELFSLYVDGVHTVVASKGFRRSLELTIADIQIDNYSETCIYPVLFYSKKRDKRKKKQGKFGKTDKEESYLERDEYLYPSSSDEDENDSISKKEEELLSLASRLSARKRNTSVESDKSVRSLDDGEIEEKSFITFTVVQDHQNNGKRSVFQYIGFRMLSFAIDVDSVTIKLCFLDFLDDLKILTSDAALALNSPNKWFHSFNYNTLLATSLSSSHCNNLLINIVETKQALQSSNKIYIKYLIIHPMKVTFSLYQSTFPMSRLRDEGKKETLQSTFLNILMSLVGIEKMVVKLSSFEVEDAIESFPTLSSLIWTKTMTDVRSQLGNIAGSLAIVGNPIGFARKVGNGVKAFFYEPYLGAVYHRSPSSSSSESNHNFLLGLRKGTKRLFSGVVTGAMDSTVAFVDTASKSITYLTGDSEYIHKRAIKRQQHYLHRSSSGLVSGLKDGGDSIVNGFTSGMTGLISKPYEEASKSGISGFFKGLGLGVLGAAVKPVVGITDGLSSLAFGISSQVDPDFRYNHIRPRRALEPCFFYSSFSSSCSSDMTSLVIVPLSLDAAYAQEFVVKRADDNNYEDSFLSFIPLDNKGEAVVLSTVFIYWTKERRATDLIVEWGNVSHCRWLSGEGVGLMLYSGEEERITIPCVNKDLMRKVYSNLTLQSHRMGNPSKVVPLDLIDCYDTSSQTKGGTNSSFLDNAVSKESMYHKLMHEASSLGILDGYRFGSVNGHSLPEISDSEAGVLSRADHSIQRGYNSWQQVDEFIWKLIWDWGCIHANLAACRCCVALFINKSDSPIQITRVQMLIGRNVILFGSETTGYETESRLLSPQGGYLVVFIMAFPQTPLEVGHLKANINSAAFTALLASTQRESSCEGKAGFTIGFLEKTVTEWWCKYVIVIT